MFRRIAFDWSGTLSDDAWPVYLANSKILSHFGIEPPTFEQWKTKTTQTPIEFFRSFGVVVEPDRLLDLYVRYYGENLKNGISPKPFEDSFEVLRWLKSGDIEMAVISSHPEIFLKEEIEKYGFSSLISKVYGSLKSGEKEQALMAFSAELYVGDTVFDIRAARAVGIKCGVVTRGYHSADVLSREGPDYVFGCLKEMKKLFESV